MTNKTKLGSVVAIVALVFAGLSLVAVGPASAHHNIPEVTVSESECGEVTFTATWSTDTHKASNASLVVQTSEGQWTSNLSESITVAPSSRMSDTILYRVWGGGERDYDSPELSDLDGLVEYINSGGSPLDVDAPGVEWHELEVEGCPEEVTAVAPTVDQFDCATDNYTGSITIPDVGGVNYEREGATSYLEPGTYTAGADTYTIFAVAEDGYIFETGEERVKFEVVVESVDECPEGTEDKSNGKPITTPSSPGAPAPAVPGSPDFTG